MKTVYISKKTYHWFLGTVSVLLIVLFAAALLRRILVQPVFSPTRMQAATLVIDAGHGGEDGGAVSVSGVYESTINLSIALKLDQLAGLFGVPVVMTRQDEVSLKDPAAETLREMKRSDLKNRAALVNSVSNPVLISIHQNNFSDARSSGAQVFYGHEASCAAFGAYTQDVLRIVLDPDNDREAKEISDEIYLMSHISCRAILVECGFLSNPDEERLLQEANYQTRIATGLLYAYLTYK